QHSSTPSRTLAPVTALISRISAIPRIFSSGQLFARLAILFKGTPLSLHLGSFGSPFFFSRTFLSAEAGAASLSRSLRQDGDFESTNPVKPLSVSFPDVS